MHTPLDARFLGSAEAHRAQDLLRACVHCGFCAAACPTYRLTGNELDGPRGRIYLIKQMLEQGTVSTPTQRHLDRCLTCGACEPACPSGVRYRELLEIGRDLTESAVPRNLRTRLVRRFVLEVAGNARRFAWAGRFGRGLRRLLPEDLRVRLPQPPATQSWPPPRHARRMLALAGCVQPAYAPQTNAAAARVLDRLGISLLEVPAAACCGALALHLSARERALAQARHNIDAWWQEIEAGAEALVMTASGCGLMVKDYGRLLADDPAYAAKAARVSALARDLAEVLAAEPLDSFAVAGRGVRVAFQCPCTLQHGQGLGGTVEDLLRRCGFVTTPVADAGQCCGSAGSYSLLQPALSARLRDDKLAALMQGEPQLIASANIGCQMHLATKAPVPVRHWIELLDGTPAQGGGRMSRSRADTDS